MKKVILFILIPLFIIMEGVSWWVYRAYDDTSKMPTANEAQKNKQDNGVKQEELAPEEPVDAIQEEKDISINAGATPYQGVSGDIENFPPVSTEVKNNRTERTIHMGVRQWAWSPRLIYAKKDELVRLVIHNADVKHGLVIPELGVDQDIPEDGAVIEFIATKKGSFDFLCSLWCGDGHMNMVGELIIS